MDHQKCYVFSAPEPRPPKRRRTDAYWNQRESMYHELWSRQFERIQSVLSRSNSATLGDIVTFVSGVRDGHHPSQIPTGLIVAGPSIASHGQFFNGLSRRISDECGSACVLLNSTECPNLKSLLKTLIKKATTRRTVTEDDDDELVPMSRRGPKRLGYDLQLLHEWCQDQGVGVVVIAMQDSEAFDGVLLAEAIELLSSWLDRISFVLLFGIATSVENLYEKLPRSALRCLSGQQFDVVQTDEVLEQVFCRTIDANQPLRLGPQLSSMLLDRQKDHIQSVQAFVDALQYAYMSHFYANPLSVFLRPNLSCKDLNEELFEALRNLPSFRLLVEQLLGRGDSDLVRKLLNSDQELFHFTQQRIEEGYRLLENMVCATKTLHALRTVMPQLSKVRRSVLYVKAASGNLAGSGSVRELLLSIRKAASNVLQDVLQALQALDQNDDFQLSGEAQEGLHALLKDSADITVPLRSEYDLRNETMRTTIIASKVELSKQKATLSKKDAAYSKLLGTFHDRLEIWFSKMLIRPQDVFPYEILMYDTKAPQRAVFTPKTRSVIERALSSPHDYLNCGCCQVSRAGEIFEATLSSTQPPTAILYQLYLESGSIINMSDLWSAFNAIIGDDEDNESLTMALFERALAELKYLGLIRSSRKKADHIAKIAWKGF